jgi:SAM-dependent methyltransferase
VINRLARIGTRIGTKFLLIPQIRLRFCKLRWKMMRKDLKFYEQPSAGVGEEVVSYNMSAFDSDAAFGCGGRMDLVLYPLAALMANNRPDAKVLIVGPRTEDDIFLSKALGFPDTRGLDLLSYSPHIDLGDMHSMPYADEQFDAVVLGWVVCYSSDTAQAFSESLRVLKKGGHLSIGWEWLPQSDKPTFENVRGNLINDVADYKRALNLPAVFVNDPPTKTNHHKSLVFRKEL